MSEMRGQASSLISSVSKVCAIRFQKEEELPLSYLKEKVDFLSLPDFDKDPGVLMVGGKLEKAPWIVKVSKNETNYEITRVRMKHSFEFEVDCSRVSKRRFSRLGDTISKWNPILPPHFAVELVVPCGARPPSSAEQ